MALTFGHESDWVRNALAADGCVIETRGRALPMRRPRLVHDEQRRAGPAPLRLIGALGNVSDFLDLRFDEDAARPAPGGGPWCRN